MSEGQTTESVRLTEAERREVAQVFHGAQWLSAERAECVERIVAKRMAAARADEREHWDDAIDAIRFYRQSWQQLREVLASVGARLDEHTYDEFAGVLDDARSDDGPFDAAVAARDYPPAQTDGRMCPCPSTSVTKSDSLSSSTETSLTTRSAPSAGSSSSNTTRGLHYPPTMHADDDTLDDDDLWMPEHLPCACPGCSTFPQILREYGQAFRSDWSSIDGRVVCADMHLLARWVEKPSTYPGDRQARAALNLSPDGSAEWANSFAPMAPGSVSDSPLVKLTHALRLRDPIRMLTPRDVIVMIDKIADGGA